MSAARRAPVASMSGYGRASAGTARATVTAEIRTVNSRGLDLSLSLPPALAAEEAALRKLVAERLPRGRVDATVTVVARGGAAARPALDAGLLRWYAGRLGAAAKAQRLEPPRIDTLAQLPGVVTRTEAAGPAAQVLPAVRKALAAAADRVVAMRRKEGAALAADLTRRLGLLADHVTAVEAAWPESVARQKERTETRLRAALARLDDGARAAAAKDLVALVDRGDVAEELTRLRSHLAQYAETLRTGGPAGRTLDFLTQELHREVNTIGSKNADAALAHRVVAMKEEIERLREQVQNLA